MVHQVVLAGEAAVERGDADTGVGGDLGHRGAGVGGEERLCGLEDPVVVGPRFGLPTSESRLCGAPIFVHGMP